MAGDSMGRASGLAEGGRCAWSQEAGGGSEIYLPITPSFSVYRDYLKILVFPFYKAQFGCFPSQVQIPRCIKSLHASIKRKFTNACTLCIHAL